MNAPTVATHTKHSEAPSRRKSDTVVRQRVALNTSARSTHGGENIMIDWKAVFDAYPDDVDSVIAKRLGCATSTVWKARTNRRGLGATGL